MTDEGRLGAGAGMRGGSAAAAPAGIAGLWRRLSRSHVRTLLVGVVGAGIGAAYAHFVGCRTGTCPITSSVLNAAIYGGGVGAVLGWPVRHR